ncbi:hypothetical protein AVEN_191050-1 [Araneus ventricosus]|uniref:Uncharacterized protein n=1 Tax=Araneus ventricosus TaxID=182803 RepID=A0A4Y2AXV9_ARAVE|nr:hypothetical protein AVEN_191050-1 [Araneus ventricosus]
MNTLGKTTFLARVAFPSFRQLISERMPSRLILAPADSVDFPSIWPKSYSHGILNQIRDSIASGPVCAFYLPWEYTSHHIHLFLNAFFKAGNRQCSEVDGAPATIKPTIRAPPPSPDLQRATELPQFIPPPPIFVPTQSPQMSPGSTPTFIPLQETGNGIKSSLTQEGQHAGGSCHPSKVHWAPDVGCEADRDAVWL